MDFRRTPVGDLLNYLLENVNVIEDQKQHEKVPQTMQQQEEPEVDLEQQNLHPHEDEEKRVAKKDRPDATREVKDDEVKNEGIVPDTKDSEETVIKKLDEEFVPDVENIIAGFGEAFEMPSEEGQNEALKSTFDLAVEHQVFSSPEELAKELGKFIGGFTYDEVAQIEAVIGTSVPNLSKGEETNEEMGGGGAGITPDEDYNTDAKLSDEEDYTDDITADEEMEESLTCCESCGKVHQSKELHECKINEEPMDSEDDYVEPQGAGVGPSYVAMAQASTDATEAATVGGASEQTSIYADHKDITGAFEQMMANLPELGLFVIDDLDMDGSDMFGIKVSTIPWTADSIQAGLRSNEVEEEPDVIVPEEEVENEGIVPDTKDNEETTIKKLDEADTDPRNSFLDAYKDLCMKHNMIIVSESETPLQVVDITAYPTGEVPMDQFVVAHIEKHVELLRGTAIELGDANSEVNAEIPLGDPVEEGCLGDEKGPVQEEDSDREKAFVRVQAEHPEYSPEQVWKVVHDQNPNSEPVAEEIRSDEDSDYEEIASLDDKGSADELARKEGGHVIDDKENRKFRVVVPKKDDGIR